VAVKIKLKRVGKVHAPQYRVIVADSRTKRDGRAIEEIGIYQPMQDPSIITIDSERVQYWLSVGAQPTEAVLALIKVTGDWQKFKGLPGAEGTLRVAETKPSRASVFEAAVKDAGTEAPAAAAKRTPAPAEAKTEAPAEAAAEPAAEPAAEAPAAESTETEAPAAESTESESTETAGA
jgi:small subunit ribosomal protein S16